MSRPMELVYSTQKHSFIQGRAYSNPRFFTTARSGIDKVFIVGDAGGKAAAIRRAYEAAGVPVEDLSAQAAVAPAEPPGGLDAPASLTPTIPEDERAKVYIPAEWRDLPWTPKPDQDLSLRSLASMVSDTPIINKAQAAAAITAELERRKATTPPAPEPTAEPESDAGGTKADGAGLLDAPIGDSGLTLQEVQADLEVLGVEFDPTAPAEEQLALRNEGRAAREAAADEKKPEAEA